MLNKSYRPKIIFSFLFVIIIFFIWLLKNFSIYSTGFSIIEISSDGNLLFHFLCAALCLLITIINNRINIGKSSFWNISKIFVNFCGISVVIIILFNVFVKPEVVREAIGIYSLEAILGLEFLISAIILLIFVFISRLFAKDKLSILTKVFGNVAIFVLIFTTILLVPAGVNCCFQSKTCNLYEFEFTNRDNLIKYKEFVENAEGYILMHEVDDKTIVIRPLYSEGTQLMNFDTVDECRKFIDKNVVEEPDIPVLKGMDPIFDIEKETMIHEREVNVEEINRIVKSNLNKMLPFAITITIVVFIIQLLLGFVSKRKMKR